MAFAFVLYLLVGPAAWLAVTVLAALGRRRMSVLEQDRSPLAEPPPTLSIVIPAKDEAAGIADCVAHVLAQDYPALQVVVVNDRSGDATGAILDRLAQDEPRLRVEHVAELPAGWLGKCHALFIGTRALTSDYLLFVDSDVQLAPDAARRVVALAARRRYEALSVMPALDARSFWERTLLPILATAWAAAFRISMTNNMSRAGHAFANGQFFLVERERYAAVGGHAAVRDQIVEDVALARVLKTTGARVRLMLGPRLARTRMHTDLPQMFNGWARIFAGSAGRSMTPALSTLAFLLVTVATLPPAAAIAWTSGDAGWTAAALLHAGTMFGFLGWTYRSAGQSVACLLAWPIAWPLVLAILANAARVCRTGRVAWRGSTVRVNDHVGASG